MKSLRFRQMSASMPSRLRMYRGMTRAFAALSTADGCDTTKREHAAARDR